MVEDALDVGFTKQLRWCHRDFVNQQIGPGAELDDVLIVARIAGYHRGAITVFDPITVSWFYSRSVIDSEGANTQAACFVDEAILDELFRRNGSVLPCQFFVFDTNFYVTGVGRFQMTHQLSRSCRPDHVKGSTSGREIRTEPPRKPEIGNANRVIGVKMSQEQGVDTAYCDAKLEQPDGGAAPGVDEDGTIASFDQRGRTEALRMGNRNPRPEQRYPKGRGHY